jgi:hypothetical protein
MTDRTPPRITLRTPTDLLAAVPYLLGFHPSHSVVAIGLRDSRVVFNVRADLPPADATEGALAGLAEHITDVLTGQSATRALIVGYGPAALVNRTVVALARTLLAREVSVGEMLRVADGRYWSYLCRSEDCCPAEGTPYDTTCTEMAAAATYAGRVALPDRTALERTVAPPQGAALATAVGAAARAEAALADELSRPGGGGPAVGTLRLRAGSRALAEALVRYRDGRPLDDDEIARLALLVATVDVRDQAWHLILAAGTNLDPHLALWRDVTVRVRPDLVAPPASLLAVTAWRDGDGALAWVAVQRAQAADPSYPLAMLVAEALLAGLSPAVLDDPAGTPRRPRRSGRSGRRPGPTRTRT